MRNSMVWIVTVLYTVASFHLLRRNLRLTTASPSLHSSTLQDIDEVQPVLPRNGIIDYIGKTDIIDTPLTFHNETLDYKPLTGFQKLSARFNLWKQLPWRKIRGKVILKASLSGSLTIQPSRRSGLFATPSAKAGEAINSLYDLMNMFIIAAQDPRILAIYIDLGRLECGYAKLAELRRYIAYFQKSGKKVIGYSNAVSEKEYFLATAFDEFYVSPEGILDLRGFVSSATFLKGVFEKIGIEPQVQRIGKYKSAGDQFNRTSLSDAQREVTSSLLTEASNYWLRIVSSETNLTKADLMNLWVENANRDISLFKERGMISGVLYEDQVEKILQFRMRSPRLNLFNSWQYNETLEQEQAEQLMTNLTDFNLTYHFEMIPRRSLQEGGEKPSPSNSTSTPGTFWAKLFPLSYNEPKFYPVNAYLRKMRKASKLLPNLPLYESRGGPRIAVINAVGGIAEGEGNGQSIGSDSVIRQIREAKEDSGIKGVVLRIDSPGGSALASDLVWRELRMLSKVKPVVANMVDVAASGGYYFSMACDQIVAEELTITGSIGVVTAKFNAKELNSKIGFNTETVSIGKYAEFFSTNRGFNADEEKLFEEFAWKAYKSFVTKAAASRNMPYDAMHEVAQGRVWTGRQALDRALVDHMGGFWKALEIVAKLSDYMPVNGTRQMRIQTFSEPARGLSSLLSGARAQTGKSVLQPRVLAFCGDEVMWSGLVGSESLGMRSGMQSLGLSPVLSHVLSDDISYGLVEEVAETLGGSSGGVWQKMKSAVLGWLM